MSDDRYYLAAEHMPEELEHWEAVEVYGESWGCRQRAGSWDLYTVGELKPWHVWRYEAPSPIPGLMDRSEAVRERIGVRTLEGNGVYVVPEGSEGGES